jgi:peptidoglycan hydrolase-like protein with peptidoglycan-binding domain
MGRTRARGGMTRSSRGAAVLTAAALLLTGCGSLGGSWVRHGSTPSPPPTSAPSASWTPAVTPTGSAEPTTVAPTTPGPSTPEPSPTATPTPTAQPTPTAKPRTTLLRGDSGPAVLALQQRLSALGYWLGAADGSFGSLTQQAVWAFQKSAGLRRDGVVGPKTRAALAAGIRPRATLRGDGVEIDLDRQVLLVVRGGAVRTILNTSTGSGEEYTSTSGNRAIAVTPRGSFTVYRAVDDYVTNSLGRLWRPRFFHRGIAVHGSPNIPPWPDSHGCARVSNAAIDMIWARDLMPVGSRVLVR